MEESGDKKCLLVYDNNRRIKREECDKFSQQYYLDFSLWKVLIGPSDWEDHSMGKEGAQRYRVHNLPKCSSCSGLYELGIYEELTNGINEELVIPVYIGQADNVRTRLQRYGRNGAHLENGSLCIDRNELIQQGSGLFSEIFSKGFAIMYRWAPMKSKWIAEETEADLLGRFDYAWNKGNNGIRRHNEILKKLDQINSINSQCPLISGKIKNLCSMELQGKVDPHKPLLLENGSIVYKNQERNDAFSRVFKVGRSNPRRVTLTFGTNNEQCASICGVALGHGRVCTKPPVEGRKRCDVHKGMKINGLEKSILHDSSKGHLPICGFFSENGDACTSETAPGRKRCEDHKGRKIKLQVAHSPVSMFDPLFCGFMMENGNVCTKNPVMGRKRCEEHKGIKVKQHKETSETGLICGVCLENGTFCDRLALVGRKRCDEHKGMKIKKKISVSVHSTHNNDANVTCGVILIGGSFCTRLPMEGRKRCGQHKGMRVNKEGSFNNSTSTYDDETTSSGICGVGLRDGSICSRMPVRGRKRCEEHKGMRVT